MIFDIKKRFLVLMLLVSVRAFAAAPNEIIHVLPDSKPSVVSESKHHKTLLQAFHDNYGRLYYFVQELTNNIDNTKDKMSFDFVNPEIDGDVQEFSKTIIPGIFLLENVEKTIKQRSSIQDIKEFLSTNYKTTYLPAKVYRENKNIARPLYILQLRELAFEAVAKGDLFALRALLDNYNLIDITSDDGYSLLSYAILHNQNAIAELLIKRGININTINSYGGTAFTISARTGNMKILKLLGEHKDCKIFHQDKFGNSAVDYAYITNNRQMQEYLKRFLKE